MSELEIKKRQEHRRNRKKWTWIQIIAIVLLAAIALGSFLIYNRMNQTYYIEYTEGSAIDYRVQYRENNFFDKEWIGAGQSYISSLIQSMVADFNYRLQASSSELNFTYRYRISACTVIASKESGAPYFTQEEELLPYTQQTATKGSSVQISEDVVIDYVKYNQLATSFINAYGLKPSASATLQVTMDVELLSQNERFSRESKNVYSTSLNIPLAVETFDVFTTASSPAGATKVLEYQTMANRKIFSVAATVAAVLAALVTVSLILFLYMTKNDDVTYTARVRRILRSYGSFIQRLEGEFDSAGYQCVVIKTFNEMLGIRDTIQAPILAFENKDETMTRFFIPTNTQLLYVFEVKVENYDEIYGTTEDVAE